MPRSTISASGVPAEARLAHPLEVLRPRPRPAQADLDDVAPVEVAVDDRAVEGNAVRGLALLAARVGVGVEVHHREAVGAVVLGEGLQHRGRERVVAAEHDRDRARGQDLGHAPAQQQVRPLQVGRVHLDVAVVDDVELGVRVDAKLHVRPRDREGHILGGADRPRAEAGAGPVGHALVEGRPQDGDVGSGKPGGLQHERRPPEREPDAGVAHLVGAVGLHAVGVGHRAIIRGRPRRAYFTVFIVNCEFTRVRPGSPASRLM